MGELEVPNGYSSQSLLAGFEGNQVAHLEKTVQEGYVVGPFFERSVEQGERSIDTSCIFPVVLVCRGDLL